MLRYETKVIRQLSELKLYECTWLDLWNRSYTSTPTMLMSSLLDWLQSFKQEFLAAVLVFDSDNKLVAAMPLIKGEKRLGFDRAKLPCKIWQDCGDLLVDKNIPLEVVLDQIIDALTTLNVSILELSAARVDRPIWQYFLKLLSKRFKYQRTSSSYQSAIIPTVDWDKQLAGLSKNIRKSVRRREKRLMEQGELTTEFHNTIDAEDVESILIRGFELELKGWKATSGQPILHNATVRNYLIRQAQDFARVGWLRAHFLNFDGAAIAFDYGWFCNGIYHSFKTSYDQSFKTNSPGQVLLCKILENCCVDPKCGGFDIMGVSSHAINVWQPDSYQVADIEIALTGTARHVLGTYNSLKSNSLGMQIYKPIKNLVSNGKFHAAEVN